MVPKVSVIVPNYNHAPYLKQRIDSILNQSFRNFELIILDDKSSDGSSKIIEQYRSNHKVSSIIYNSRNSGSTFAQWEKGLKLARGEWVWIAESDDYADPSFLETLLRLVKQYDNVGIAFSNSHWIDHNSEAKEDLSIYKESFFRTGADEITTGMCIHCTIQNVSATLLKRDLALNAVKNLSKFKACGDWMFYTRMLHHSNIAYTAEKLNYFRWYHPSVSSYGKKKLWITEGVQVLENIDYHIIKFTSRVYLKVVLRWVHKAASLRFNGTLEAMASLAKASFNFLRFG